MTGHQNTPLLLTSTHENGKDPHRPREVNRCPGWEEATWNKYMVNTLETSLNLNIGEKIDKTLNTIIKLRVNYKTQMVGTLNVP